MTQQSERNRLREAIGALIGVLFIIGAGVALIHLI